SGIVALGDGGHVLFSGPKPQKNLGAPELSLLGMEVMCWFSGPAPQKNVGGMKEDRAGFVALGYGGHVLVLRFAPQKNVGGMERAGFVVLGDGGRCVLSPVMRQKRMWVE
ncbi:hypothetical protein TNCV_2907761, partial [Trichonephila clavipes]